MSRTWSRDDMAVYAFQILRKYYPATALWWQGPENVCWWRDWTEKGFGRELRAWQTLAEATHIVADRQTRIWGEWARWSIRRIRWKSYRRPHAPLSHARRLVQSLRVLTLSGHLSADQVRAILLPMDRWLLTAAGIVEGTYWDGIAAQLEASCLVNQLESMKLQLPHSRWPTLVTAVESYLGTVRRRLTAADSSEPWVDLAHLNTWDWHWRRQEWAPPMTVTAVETLASPTAILGDGVEVRTVGGLHQEAWLLGWPRREVVRGQHAVVPAWLVLAAEWCQRTSQPDVLTWLFSPPAAMEAALWEGCRQWSGTHPRDPGSASCVRWLTAQQALALADEWLWMEGGAPQVVADWLATWWGSQARAWVPRMLASPGRQLARECARLSFTVEMGETWDEARAWAGWTDLSMAF